MAAMTMMSEMTWPEYDRRVRIDRSVILLPVGSTEQHGPHLPLGVDHQIPTAICKLVAELCDAIVAPPVTFGYKSQPKSGGGNHFPGTVSLDAATFISLIRDILLELARHGARRVAVFDGHYENGMFLVEAIDLALRDLRRLGIEDMRIARIDYWNFIDAETEALLFGGKCPDWGLEHGAVMETSVMMHFHPGFVRTNQIPDHPAARFPRYDLYPVDIRNIPADGVLSSAAPASAQKGKRVVEQIVPELAKAVKEALAD
jgi:creatinine amidohydrolase